MGFQKWKILRTPAAERGGTANVFRGWTRRNVQSKEGCYHDVARFFRSPALSRLAESPLRVSLKCEPQLAEQLRDAHKAVLPGYHLNKRHWNTVILDGSIPKQMIKDLVEDSYDLVVSQLPLSARRALGWQPQDG